jgi:hypothetical protein
MPTLLPDIRQHIVITTPPATLPPHFHPHTSTITIHNYQFDLNLAYGLLTALGNLDISAVLSFQWGTFQKFANIYS